MLIMATTTGRSHSDGQQRIPSTSSIDTVFAVKNEEVSESGTLQAIVSHQSLDTAATGGDATAPTIEPRLAQESSVATPSTLIVASVQQRNDSYSTSHASTSPLPNTNTVPEFLYQLTKMLTDNNRDIIEWSNGA